jgi:hypothetical protein
MELELALLIGPEAPGSAPEYVISVCASDRRSVTLSSLATGAVATWIPKTPSDGDLASTITGLVAIHLMGIPTDNSLRSDFVDFNLQSYGPFPSDPATVLAEFGATIHAVVPVGEQFDLGFFEALPYVTLAVCAAEGR